MLLPCRLRTRISTASSATNMRPSAAEYPRRGGSVFNRLRTFHENNLRQWYRWSLGFLGLDLHERLAFALRQLCSVFGVEESRGTLLRIAVSQKDLADLVGASRPRVTEHLAKLERERVLMRQGRQLIVRLDRMENLSISRPERSASVAKAGTPALFRKEDHRRHRHSMAVAVSTN